MVPSRLDTGKPRYTPRRKPTELNTDLLDGILSSMKRETFRRMRSELFNEEEEAQALPYDEYMTPTLGRPDFFRPVPGRILSLYGWRERFHRVHHGVDLALNIGDTVRAAVSGTVAVIAYDHDGYGHYVKMSHPDGMETIYGHLQYPIVAQGQFVYAGQPIGIGGNTGNSTGPHLHFETRLGGVAIDPMLIFNFYGGVQYLYAAEESQPVATTKAPTFSHQSKSLKKETTYIVRYGDTPESVARQAGISVMRLRQLNMLSDGESLPIGRMLKLK